MPIAMRVTRDPERLQQARQVDGGRLAFDGRARGEDHLLDLPRADALEEPPIRSSSGPTPESGDSTPCSTW